MSTKTFLAEFKEFALRGNVIDLAVGIVIGSAFGGIVTSLVNNILMPLLSIVIGRINISSLSLRIHPSIGGMSEIVLPYGSFLQAVINFLIIAFCIFLFVKLIGRRKKKEPEKPGPTTEALLAEIRDLLKENGGINKHLP